MDSIYYCDDTFDDVLVVETIKGIKQYRAGTFLTAYCDTDKNKTLFKLRCERNFWVIFVNNNRMDKTPASLCLSYENVCENTVLPAGLTTLETGSHLEGEVLEAICVVGNSRVTLTCVEKKWRHRYSYNELTEENVLELCPNTAFIIQRFIYK